MNTAELCRKTRITPRMAQWWCEQGVAPHHFQGREREFDDTDAVVVAIIAELRRKGVSLARVQRLRLSRPKDEFLVLYEKGHCWCSGVELVPALMDAPTACVVVSLQHIRARLNRQ